MYIYKQYDKVLESLLKGDMILSGGNGGSMTDSMHFVCELTGRFDGNTKEYPAIAMGSNQSELTAFGNDYGYNNIFVPYIRAFKKFNPSFLFITTSGSSENILNAINVIDVEYGTLENVSILTSTKCSLDINELNILAVDSDNTQKIQEEHIKILHLLAGDIKSYNVL